MATSRTPGHRERLLAAALQCLQDKGYARTTARDLVTASGTNLASIGYHYGSKEALLNEAVAVSFRDWAAAVERSAFARDDATSLERLERSLAAMIDGFNQLRPFLVSFVEAFPPAVRSPELRDRMAQAYDESRSGGAAMIRRAAESDGAEISQEHAETLASLLIAVCDGLILQFLLDPGAVPSSDAIVDALESATRLRS